MITWSRFPLLFAICREDRNLVSFRSPVNSHEVSVLRLHIVPPSKLSSSWQAPMRPRPCTGARSADFPLEAHQGRIFWDTGPPRQLEVQGVIGYSRKMGQG